MSAPEYYKYPDLADGSVQSRLKRIERTVQFTQRGLISQSNAQFRTVAASAVDRDGNIIAAAIAGTIPNEKLAPIKLNGIVQQRAVTNMVTNGTTAPGSDTLSPGQITTYTDTVTGIVYVGSNNGDITKFTALP